MRLVSALVMSAILVLSGGCSLVGEKDFADLESSSLFDRRQAIEAIGQRRIPRFFPFEAFIDTTRAKRAAIVIARSLETGNENREMQLNMLAAIEKLAHYVQVPASGVIEKLDDEDPEIRARAVHVLAGIGGEEATSALLRALREQERNYSIIWALGEIGHTKAIPVLNQLLNSKDRYVSHHAYKALMKINRVSTDGKSVGKEKERLVSLARATFDHYTKTMEHILNSIARWKQAV